MDLYEQKRAKMLVWVQRVDLYKHLFFRERPSGDEPGEGGDGDGQRHDDDLHRDQAGGLGQDDGQAVHQGVQQDGGGEEPEP